MYRFAIFCAALVATAALLGSSASAVNGTLYVPLGNAGGLTSPMSGVWVGNAPNATNPGRLWVSDHMQGFCRLDPIKGSKPQQWQVTNRTTDSKACFPASNNGANVPGQPDFRPIAGSTNLGFAYVPINTGLSNGVYRLTIDYIKQEINKVELLEPVTALAILKFLPIAVSMGADGKLYVADNTAGTIVRITNPAGLVGTQTVESVGVNSGSNAGGAGQFITGMSMQGNDLYNAASSFLYRIPNANLCTGSCVATNLNINSQAVGADYNLGTNHSSYLYFDSFGTLLNAEIGFRYDTISGELVEYSNGGADAAGAFYTYAAIFGMVVDPAGNIYVLDDTSGGILPDARRPIVLNAGRTWFLPVNAVPYLSNSGPLTPPPVVSGTPTPSSTGNLVVSTTSPKSVLQIPGALGGHLWVSDAVQGLCRVDVGTTAMLSNCFKPTPTFVAGQASYGQTFDPFTGAVLTSSIYVPDSSIGSSAVYGVAFDPTTETILGGANISQSKNNATATILGPDGSLYVSYANVNQIDKYTTPTTIPTLVQKIGQTLSGSGVHSMTFMGNNLFLAETTQVTELQNAAPSLTRGTAQLIGGPFTNKQTPPLKMSDPLSLASDNSSMLYIGDNGHLYSFNMSTFLQSLVASSGTSGSTTVPFAAVTAVGYVPASGTAPAHLYAGDDHVPSAGIGLGHIWQVQ